MSKKKAFTFDDFEREEENDNEASLDSDMNEIYSYMSTGKLESYSVSKNKKGTFVTVKIKLGD